MRGQALKVRLPVSLHAELVATAEEENISLNTLVVSLLAGALAFNLDTAEPRSRD